MNDDFESGLDQRHKETAQAYARTLELQNLLGLRVIAHQVPKGTARKIRHGVM